jgi:para-aminobenzoate synthetase/4-amino-4-deoxychorismate lyase
MDTLEVFALLDDASPEAHAFARSRLYSGHAGTLRCIDAARWPALLADMQQALARGLYAVPLLTYELGAHLQSIDAPAPDAPLAQVLLFEKCERMTAKEVEAWLATRAASDTPAGIAGIEANVGEAEFSSAIARIRDYIAAGDTYQVNYTYRLRFDAFGPLFALYCRLRARQPVPYGALIALPDGGAVLSFSPELFVRHDRGTLLARPMKGTASASEDDTLNEARARDLAADTKNRAENLMIVDLLRNDVGRDRQRAGAGAVRRAALRQRAADDVDGAGQAAPRRRAGRSVRSAVPVRLDHRGTQAAHDGDHSRTGSGAARPLHRCDRLVRSARAGACGRRLLPVGPDPDAGIAAA